MKSKPILFSSAMINAILSGTKTQTRRFALSSIDELNPNHPPHSPFLRKDGVWQWLTGKAKIGYNHNSKKCPYGKDGDLLWVRETWIKWEYPEKAPFIYGYKADGFFERYGGWEKDTPAKLHDIERVEKWKPSIHMPKDAARIFLKVTNVRVERLQDISEEDAIAEGVLKDVKIPIADFKTEIIYRDYTGNTAGCLDARSSFMTLWISINGEKSWKENPWVWVVEFEKIDKPEKF